MKLPKRFALSTLLLVMLLVSLVFGYAQWRRQWLLQEVNSLDDYWKSQIVVNDNWFWPMIRTAQVVVIFGRDEDGIFKLNSTLYGAEEAKKYYLDVRRKLTEIGVKQVAVGIALSVKRSDGTSSEVIQNVAGVESLDEVFR